MLTGYERFRDTFAPYKDSFVVIGGTAIEMLRGPNPRFPRTTKDIDMVVMTPSVDPEFAARLSAFVKEGGYECYFSGGRPHFYRFMRPKLADYPYQLEMLTRSPLPENKDIHYVRISEKPDESLSAMVMDSDYYDFVQRVAVEQDGFRRLSSLGLIVFKAHAYQNLMAEYERTGDGVLKTSAAKHRRDVFLLVQESLPSERLELPQPIADRMRTFLAFFPPTSDLWPAILSSVRDLAGDPASYRARFSSMFNLGV